MVEKAGARTGVRVSAVDCMLRRIATTRRGDATRAMATDARARATRAVSARNGDLEAAIGADAERYRGV